MATQVVVQLVAVETAAAEEKEAAAQVVVQLVAVETAAAEEKEVAGPTEAA